ncbi:hypothetical protein IC575_008212 [Cucumis melo]
MLIVCNSHYHGFLRMIRAILNMVFVIFFSFLCLDFRGNNLNCQVRVDKLT